MGLRIAEHASLTDVGRQRHTNEDNFFEDPPVFAVADGMGGAQAGEVASEMAVDQFRELGASDGTPEEQLAQIARGANRKIWEMAQSDSRRAGMGTTLVSVMVGEHDVSVGHVGDSRLYLLRSAKLEQLTNDHSLVEEFVRQGRLTREQAEKHPQRSVITRALGPEAEVEVDTFTYPARDGDIFLLCSDGLSTMLSDSQIASILGSGESVAEIAKELVEAANERGGRDNITVVVFRLEDDGNPGSRHTDTASYDTIAGDEQAPTTEQIEAERRRISEMETQAASLRPAPADAPESVPTGVATATRIPQRASPKADPLPDPYVANRPRRTASRRGRWLIRTLIAAILVLAIAGGALYAFGRSVYFLGTDDQGLITLYRGYPYDLPLGVHLYSEKFVSGVPALALSKDRRGRVLDHQLRSKSDATDLIKSLDVAESR